MTSTSTFNKQDISFNDQIIKILDLGKVNTTDTVLHFGAGFDVDSNMEIQQHETYVPTLTELLIEWFTWSEQNESPCYTGVDTNPEKIETLSNKFINQEFAISSMQEFLDNLNDLEFDVKSYEWTLITGIFDKPIYGDKQYEFIQTTIETCQKFTSKGLLFTIEEKPIEDFTYSIIYLYTLLITLYDKVLIQKTSNNQYIFFILF